MNPRYGESVDPKQTYRKRPGAYVILPLGGAILLTHQVDPVPEFQLPGGGIDAGEQILPALHREVAEETGWSITNIKRVSFYRRFVYMPEYDLWAEKLCTIFAARPVRRISDPTEPGHTAHFVPKRLALEILASTGDQRVLERFLSAEF